MAEVYRRVEEVVEALPGVQNAIRQFAFEIEAEAIVRLEAARSESLYIGRRFNDDAVVYSRRSGKSQWMVVLDDSAGDGAAGNIEEGRLPYWWRTNTKGRVAGEPYGGMDGLEIIKGAIRVVKNRHRRA